MSSALRKLTTEVCGTSFGVRVYRQLSIAITERHLHDISRPFDRYDESSSTHSTGVAFAWQSGHRPMERGLSHGIENIFQNFEELV